MNHPQDLRCLLSDFGKQGHSLPNVQDEPRPLGAVGSGDWLGSFFTDARIAASVTIALALRAKLQRKSTARESGSLIANQASLSFVNASMPERMTANTATIAATPM